MNKFHGDAFTTQALFEQLAKLNIVIGDENAVHILPRTTTSMRIQSFGDGSSLYITLPCLTNLYRVHSEPVLKS